MSIQILTKNGVDNTNIDGARANHFNAGQRSGIVKGAFNEGTFSAISSNIIGLDTCELRICGHQIIIDSVQSITLTNRPATPTRYSMVAQILVDSSSVPTFSLFIQPSSTPLIQNNLFSSIVGNGTYQIEIGKFTLDTNGTISDVVRTADIITGASENGYDYINIGEVTTTMVASGVDAEVDIENVEVDGEKQTNFHFSIPETAGTAIDINGVQQSSLSFNSDPQTQISSMVSYNAQSPTSAEQEQAKKNIGLSYARFLNNPRNMASGLANCSTYGEIHALALATNNGQLFASVGNLEGDSNLKTLLGNPTGGNYTVISVTAINAIGTYEYKVELTALGLYNGRIAKGYIWDDGAYYHWSGWIQDSKIEKVDTIWTGGIASTGVIQDIDLSAYKLARVYYDCYDSTQENYGVKGGVIEFDPTRSWSAASQALVYSVYDSQTGWEFHNTMGVVISYDPTAHTVSVKMHYGGTLQTSDLYAVYKIEGVRR